MDKETRSGDISTPSRYGNFFGLFPSHSYPAETKCTSVNMEGERSTGFGKDFILLFIINASLPTALALVILSIQAEFSSIGDGSPQRVFEPSST